MNQKKSNRIKNGLWGIILLGISIPFIQQFTHFANEKELKGAQKLSLPLEFNGTNWFNGNFQKGAGSYLNEYFGFRSSFVRFHNQLQYSFFNKVFVKDVVLGKESQLYESIYIKAYYGEDFIGRDSISRQVHKLSYLQDTLGEIGKHLLVILAPGKGTFFSAFIPESHKQKKDTTNYEVYADLLSTQKVNYIDFQRWFLDSKESSKYPLYTKGGIHWSRFGEILVTDSILNWIGATTGEKMPKLVIDELLIKTLPEGRDNDIGEAMNLLFEYQGDSLAYPKYHIEHPDRNTVRSSFIADSYYWGIHASMFTEQLFGDGQFWYYNQEIHQTEASQMKNVAEVNVKEEILKNDVIVIMATDANLSNLGFGFIDELYRLYMKE